MGYNLKNVSNGKSAFENTTTAKFDVACERRRIFSVTALVCSQAKFEAPDRLRFIRQFEVSQNLEDVEVLLSNNFFHTNLLILLKIQTVINSDSLMMGASNLAILVFSMRCFRFWHFSCYTYSP